MFATVYLVPAFSVFFSEKQKLIDSKFRSIFQNYSGKKSNHLKYFECTSYEPSIPDICKLFLKIATSNNFHHRVHPKDILFVDILIFYFTS